MDSELARYQEAILKKVCSICIERSAGDVCTISGQGKCTIEQFLPEIIETATTVNSDKIDDYVSALRTTICRACRPNGDMNCAIRNSEECVLDRYFVLIVEAIEEVVLKQRQSSAR
jgi:hypothetical protein